MKTKDPQLSKLFKKAFPKQKPPIKRNPKGADQYLSKLDPERFQVFRRTMVPSAEILSGFFLLNIIVLSSTYAINWDLFTFSIAGIVLLFAGYNLFLHLWHWFFYRGSMSRLPFPVEGWEHLVNRESIEYDLVWHNASIVLHLGSADPVQIKAIQAALQIFFKKANKKFYTRDSSASDAPTFDPRNDWEIKLNQPPLIKAEGSSNPEVIGQIYKLLQGNLSMLERKFPGLIKSVELSYTDQYQQVDIDIPISSA